MTFDLRDALYDLAADPVVDAHDPQLPAVAARVRWVQLRRRTTFGLTGAAAVAGVAFGATALPFPPHVPAPPAEMPTPDPTAPEPTDDPTPAPWQPAVEQCGEVLPDDVLHGLMEAYGFRRPDGAAAQASADPAAPVPLTVDLVLNIEGMPEDVPAEVVDARVLDVLAATWDEAAAGYRVEAVSGTEPDSAAEGPVSGLQALAVPAGAVQLVSCESLQGDAPAPPAGDGYELFVEMEVTAADGSTSTFLGRPGLHVGTVPEQP